MSEQRIDDFTTAWAPDPSGLWVTGSAPSAAHFGEDGAGLWIEAGADTSAGPLPYAESRPAVPLDLRQADELRFWIRSDRRAHGGPDAPFYLAFEADTDPAAPAGPWRRLVPIATAGEWELVTLWLGDMPAELRRAVAVLRLCGLDRATEFRAQVDDLLATRPEPVRDLETALHRRLDRAFTVAVGGAPTPVPAVVSVPDGPQAPDPPYLLIIPWKVLPLGLRASAREASDNFTGAGLFVRPAPVGIRLEYALDVVAEEPDHRDVLRERVLDTMARRPRVTAGNVAVELVAFDGDPGTELATPARRTPLFYRAVVSAETGDRRFVALARPFLLAGAAGPGGVAEPVRV
jgi:hypothetical protein